MSKETAENAGREIYDTEALLAFAGLADESETIAAEVFGIARTQLRRYRAQGLTSEQADYFACKVAGVVPYRIWPEWLDVGIAMVKAEDERRLELQRKKEARLRSNETPEQRERRLARYARRNEANRQANRDYAASYRRRNKALIAQKRRERSARRREQEQVAS